MIIFKKSRQKKMIKEYCINQKIERSKLNYLLNN